MKWGEMRARGFEVAVKSVDSMIRTNYCLNQVN